MNDFDENISCCIIAIQKDEPYLNEWIDYHIKQGFSHIFLIDNNDIGNELVIDSKYKGYVSVFPANSLIEHHISRIQAKLYNFVLDYIKAINSIKQIYTHVLCIDIDEYFWYFNGDINDFIKNELQNNILLSIPWLCYDDNNIIYKKDLKYNTVIENYPNVAKRQWIRNEYKTIVRITINTKLGIHYHNNLEGKFNIIDKSIAHIKHYRTQCLEEYIDKIILRKCWDNQWWYEFGNKTIQVYFNYNKITNEKLDAFKYFYNKYNLEISKEDQKFINQYYKEKES